MIISSIYDALKSSNSPVAKVLHKSPNSRTVCMGFNQGMELKEHKANIPTTLVVLEGSILYSEEGKEVKLSKFDEYIIPVEVLHAVEAVEDSLIILIQG